MRGLQWFNALSVGATAVEGLPNSLKVADGVLGEQPVRYIAVVTDAQNHFPRARKGEVGLLEGWGLAKAVDEAIARGDKRPIIAIVDVPSQAYGRREEALGIHQALAASVPPMAYDIDSYASLGLLWETLSVSHIEQPTPEDVAQVSDCLVSAIKDIASTDLSGRLGATNRAASSHVRQLLREQW